MMQVSVIIPVYNAADFVQQSVESALAQPETGEVILVEDCSADNSWAVCNELASRYDRVLLHRHPDGKNHGEAASRNLAISRSSCEFIACLDADDFFLPDRFSRDREILESDPTLDGVYNALGEHVEDAAARERWLAARRDLGALTTMTVAVPPEKLYETLVAGQHGYFHLNATTIKRSVFQKTGPFNTKLRLHTDMDMLWKMAAVARLSPGSLDAPVALRRIHGGNTISAPRPRSNVYATWMLLLREAWKWARRNVDATRRQFLLRRYLTFAEFFPLDDAPFHWTHIYRRRLFLLGAAFRDPSLLRKSRFWERLLPPRLSRGGKER